MKVTRRSFLGTSGAGIAATAALPGVQLALPGSAEAQQAPAAPQTEVTIEVNGAPHRLTVEDRWTLDEVDRKSVV